MNQVLLGAAGPYILGLILYAARGGRASLRMLILAPVLMTLSALWAVAPDLPRLFGAHALYLRLSLDPRINLFWWHYSIDQMESDSAWYPILFLAMVGSLLAAALRELYRAETAAGMATRPTDGAQTGPVTPERR